MNSKNILIVAAVAVIGALALWGLAGNKSSYPTQTGTVQEATLDSDLTSLDETDLDSGIDAQLEQLSSDSSSF